MKKKKKGEEEEVDEVQIFYYKCLLLLVLSLIAYATIKLVSNYIQRIINLCNIF